VGASLNRLLTSHFVGEAYADGTDRLARCDFPLVFYSDQLGLGGTGIWGDPCGVTFARDPKGRGFESRPVRFQVTALGKLLKRMCLCRQAV